VTDTDPPPQASADNLGEGLALLALGVGLFGAASCVAVGALGVFIQGAGLVALGLPLVGLVAILLGALALRSIARSSGTEGRGFAVAGVIIGIAVLVIPGAFAVGVARTYLSAKQRVAPVVDAMLAEADAGNAERGLDALAEAVEDVDADRLTRFLGAVEVEIGDLRGADVRLRTVFRLKEPFREAQRDGRLDETRTPSVASIPKPVRLEGDAGAVIAWVLLDEDALARDQVRLVDMLVVLEGGRGILLREAGPLSEVAAYLGLTLERY
jgi:hypothetical protein